MGRMTEGEKAEERQRKIMAGSAKVLKSADQSRERDPDRQQTGAAP